MIASPECATYIWDTLVASIPAIPCSLEMNEARVAEWRPGFPGFRRLILLAKHNRKNY